jgi:hypothetical protein
LGLSGVTPALHTLDKGPLSYFAFFWHLSPPRWGIEFFWYVFVTNNCRVTEVAATPFTFQVQNLWTSDSDKKAELFNRYNWDGRNTAIIIIALLAVLWNVLAFFALKLTNRKKQK